MSGATYYAAIDSSQAAAGAAAFTRATASMRQGAQQVDGALTSVQGGLGKLKAALAALAVVETARQIILAADAFVTMRGRLEALTGSAGAAQQAMDALGAAATRARVPAGELTQTYIRIAGAMEGLHRPATDAVAVTETLAKIVRVSGISGQEASAGMMQLAQAIASGRFQGDEFRSVAENMPVVLKILQEQTGKTAGQLRALASDGKITGDILVTALLAGAERVDAQFAKMPLTFGQAFELLRSDLARVAGAMAEQSGVSKEWAGALEEVRKLITSGDFASGFKTLTDGLAGLGKALKDTIPDIALLVRGLLATKLVSDELAAEDFWAYEKAALKSLGEMLGGWFKGQVEAAAQSVNGPLLSGLSDVAAKALAASDAMHAIGKGAALSEWKGGTTVTRDPGKISFGENQQLAALRLQNEIARAQIAADGQRVAQLQTELAVRQTVTDELRAQDKELAAQLEKEIRIKGALEQQREAAGLAEQIRMAGLKNELTKAEIADNQSLVASISRELAVRQSVTEEMRSAHPELAKQLESQVLIAEQLARTAETTRELKQQGEQFAGVLTTGLQDIALKGASVAEVFRSMASRLADVVFELTVAKPLAQSLSGAFAGAGGLSGIFGGAGEAAGGWATSVLPFADGGVFGGPIALTGAGGFRGVMAEDGPEAIMPLSRGPDGALGVRASGAGGSPVSINVHVAGDASDATVARIDAAVRSALVQAAPEMRREAVSAVRREIRDNPSYLKR